MTICIPTWLYWYGAPPLMFVLGYLYRWSRERAVPPDPYLRKPQCDEETARRCERARTGHVDAPTSKHEVPRPGSVDKGAS